MQFAKKQWIVKHMLKHASEYPNELNFSCKSIEPLPVTKMKPIAIFINDVMLCLQENITALNVIGADRVSCPKKF